MLGTRIKKAPFSPPIFQSIKTRTSNCVRKANLKVKRIGDTDLVFVAAPTHD